MKTKWQDKLTVSALSAAGASSFTVSGLAAAAAASKAASRAASSFSFSSTAFSRARTYFTLVLHPFTNVRRICDEGGHTAASRAASAAAGSWSVGIVSAISIS